MNVCSTPINRRIKELPYSQGETWRPQSRNNNFCPTLAVAEPQRERSENAVSTVKIHRAKGAIALTGQRTGKRFFLKELSLRQFNGIFMVEV